jgi:hypothetical protein
LDAIDATARDIIECSLEHCAARSRSTGIASNSGHSSTAVLARSWFAIASRGSVSVRHPLGRGSKASEIFEINVDRSKRKRTPGRHSSRDWRVVRRSRVTAGNIDVTAA